MRGKSKTGDLHFYYFCRGRRLHDCDLPYLPIAKAETAVLNSCATITRPTSLRERINTLVEELLTGSTDAQRGIQARVTKRLEEPNAKETASRPARRPEELN